MDSMFVHNISHYFFRKIMCCPKTEKCLDLVFYTFGHSKSSSALKFANNNLLDKTSNFDSARFVLSLSCDISNSNFIISLKSLDSKSAVFSIYTGVVLSSASLLHSLSLFELYSSWRTPSSLLQ